MDEKDLPSCSDDSDADFVPKEEEYNSNSGSEVSDYEDSETEDKTTKGRKRKKGGKKMNKKAKKIENENSQEVTETKEKEVDVDALWADFKKDVNNTDNRETKKETSKLESETTSGNKNVESSEDHVQKNATVKTMGVVNLPNKSKVGGLSSVLNKIGKKDKMSTLQKSQMDWNKFKKTEGIEEEIRLYNKGKDGYLDKQDFLQRTDLRQFEIEKDLRSTRRKF